MGRRFAFAVFVALAACSADKPGLEHTIPHDVKAGATVACQADTAALRTAEETAFATKSAYSDQPSELHKVTVNANSYAITIADARCGAVGHRVGQTPTDY